MSKVKIFICYSDKDKRFAGVLKNYFENYIGFEIFLAHDDLDISDNWPREVQKRLRGSDLVVPLISKSFLCSCFANQEVGLALAYGKKIIPLSIDGENPPGFINNIQAHKCIKWTDEEYIDVITQVFFLPIKHPQYQQFKQDAINSLVDALSKSSNFIITSVILNIMIKVHPIQEFNEAQLVDIKRSCKANPNIYKTDFLFPKIQQFLRVNYGIVIDK